MIWIILFLVLFFVILYRVKGIDGPPDHIKKKMYDDWK